MKTVVLLLLSLSTSVLFCQQISPQVIASSGSSLTHQDIGTVAFTLGEISTHTFSNTIILTQGFHQPQIEASTATYDEPIEFTLYPNPTRQFIRLDYALPGPLVYSIQNILGITWITGNIMASPATIDLQNIPNGIYFLHIRTSQQHQSQTIKFIKL